MKPRRWCGSNGQRHSTDGPKVTRLGIASHSPSCHMSLTRDTIIEFMKARADPLCATCLSKAVGLKFNPVMDAVSDIRLRGDLPIRTAVCSNCGLNAYVLAPPHR